MALTQYTDRYIYDKGLNLTHIYHNDVSQIQGVVPSSNRLSQFHYDDAGNQLETENVDEITYNSEGQIALTKKVTGEVTVAEYYTYSAPGRRVKKVTQKVTSDVVTRIDIALYVGGNEYRTSYTGNHLVYDGDVVTGNISVIQDNVETRVKSGHCQVAKITQNSQSQSTLYSYNLINNIDSNSVEIDNISSISSFQNFRPYGGIASTWGNTENKQLGYSGQELDSTSLNCYGFRYYNSQSGRWTRPDPIGFRSGQWNLYAIVGGNPVSFRDQKGLNKWDELIVYGFVREEIGQSKHLTVFSDVAKKVLNYYDHYNGLYVLHGQSELHKKVNSLIEKLESVEGVKDYVSQFGQPFGNIDEMDHEELWTEATYCANLINIFATFLLDNNEQFSKRIGFGYANKTIELKSNQRHYNAKVLGFESRYFSDISEMNEAISVFSFDGTHTFGVVKINKLHYLFTQNVNVYSLSSKLNKEYYDSEDKVPDWLKKYHNYSYNKIMNLNEMKEYFSSLLQEKGNQKNRELLGINQLRLDHIEVFIHEVVDNGLNEPLSNYHEKDYLLPNKKGQHDEQRAQEQNSKNDKCCVIL